MDFIATFSSDAFDSSRLTFHVLIFSFIVLIGVLLLAVRKAK